MAPRGVLKFTPTAGRVTCRLGRLRQVESFGISLASGPTAVISGRGRRVETSGTQSPPISPLPAAVLLQLRKRDVPLRNERVSNRFGNPTGVVVVVPQSGQDAGGVHVLHFLVVLKGIPMDIG